jgi:uncharacterized membrane protein YfcA
LDPSYLLVFVAAIIIGIAKTSFGGLGAISVAILAFIMPTKESTAAVLIMLLTGDVVAVLRYRSHADWMLLRALLPAVLPGLLLGALFINFVADDVLRTSIGAMLLISVLTQLVLTMIGRANRAKDKDTSRPPRALSIGAGIAAGFTTMAANAAGPVMALYLQLSKVNKLRFLGTAAWFYFIVNLTKTPFSAALGLFTPQVLRIGLSYIPVVLLGTVIGIWLIGHVRQRAFDIFTLLTSVIAAAALLVL